MPRRLWMVGLSSLLATACSSGAEPAPLLPSCTVTTGTPISLGVAAYTAVDLTQTAGCAVFPGNPSNSAAIRYLVVPQSASPTPNESQAYELRGNPLQAPLTAAAGAATAPPGVARQFDLTLRRAEREFAAQVPRPPRAPPRAPALVTPVDSGNVRTFKVCNVLTCDPRKPSTFATVTATARKIGSHIAIYVDNAAPTPGLSETDLNAVRTLFDTRLYELDTLAFGRESDIDNNGMVIVLMTSKVNSLVTSDSCAATGYVAGYFFGADLITTPPFATGNNGEIFYSIVPDQAGSLSCAHPVSDVTQLVPVTFVHEFQHMISFNQHFLTRGSFPEDLWLNEGLSHYAEELGGRTFLPDTTTFCRYVRGDLYNSGQYFAAPQDYFVVDTSGIGGLANRGAYWLFVRYLVDQFAADTSLAASHAFTRTLEATTVTGAANVSGATGASFTTVLERWALANYVSDLPGFSAPPELQYVSWKFRTAYPRFNAVCSSKIPAVFPLDTATHTHAASAIVASGVLRAGSGSYYVTDQAPNAPEFRLQVGGFGKLLFARYPSLLGAALVPRLNVIRIQ
jgi:hypothetical protein